MDRESNAENYWIKPRIELKKWLYTKAPELGELYEGALIMLFDNRIPGRFRFIAHAVREIRNRLPDVVLGVEFNKGVQYTNALDTIVIEWEKAGFSFDGSIPPRYKGDDKGPPLKARRAEFHGQARG